jgi:hypothetical protein
MRAGPASNGLADAGHETNLIAVGYVNAARLAKARTAKATLDTSWTSGRA